MEERAKEHAGVRDMAATTSNVVNSALPSKETVKLWLAVFTIVCSISIAIVHTSINTLSESSVGGLTDSYFYVDEFYGKQTEGHWQYRIVTIELVRLVPNQVERLLKRDVTPYRRAHIHFAIVNVLFLILGGCLFFTYSRDLLKSVWLAILGSVIFLTSRTNLLEGGAPMVDAGAFFFLLLGAWAILRVSPVWLFIAMLVGVFTKETTLLLWPLLWLTDHLSTRQKMLFSILLVPGTVAFLIFRFVLYPDPAGSDFFSIEKVPDFVDQVRGILTPNGLIDLVSSFSLFWIPAAFAMFRLSYPSILRRWLWLIPLLMVMVLFLGGNFGRILFLAFPVVIPLALIGLRHWIVSAKGVFSAS